MKTQSGDTLYYKRWKLPHEQELETSMCKTKTRSIIFIIIIQENYMKGLSGGF